jgi:hypothetical protein
VASDREPKGGISHEFIKIQGVYKRLARFQLKINLILTLHWQNAHRQQWQLSKFF